MNLGLQQNLTLTQQLVMTPQLQQAIKLLQLSRLELASVIQQEIEENPALDDSFQEISLGADTEEPEPVVAKEEKLEEITIEDKMRTDTDWESYINEYNSTGRVYSERDFSEAPNYEAFTSSKETLESHLQWQLLMQSPSPEEEQIGSVIIGNLNIDGYLCATIEEVAEAAGAPVETVEKQLKIMQIKITKKLQKISISQ